MKRILLLKKEKNKENIKYMEGLYQNSYVNKKIHRYIVPINKEF